MGNLVKTGSKYDDSIRRRAVVELHTLGNVASVSRAIGIPERTLHDWCKEDWFQDVSAEVRVQIGESILAANLATVQKSTNELLERLEGGDTVLTANGRERLPVKARDLAVISGIFQDKARVQMGLATSITKPESMSSLAKQFQELSDQVARDRSVVSTQPQEESKT